MRHGSGSDHVVFLSRGSAAEPTGWAAKAADDASTRAVGFAARSARRRGAGKSLGGPNLNCSWPETRERLG